MGFGLMLLLLLWGCGGAGTSDPAVGVVAANLGPNDLGVDASALKTLPNTKGEGTFVYVPETRINGVERKVIWLVIDGKAYPLNGATKGSVTPTLPWPREAPQSVWARTGLSPYMPNEANEIVFDSQ
jgi:hypothetical protein